MVGRKRKSGLRRPNGRLSQAIRQDDPRDVPQTALRRVVAHSMLGDWKLSQLAKIRFNNEMTEPMAAAAAMFREDRDAFSAMIDDATARDIDALLREEDSIGTGCSRRRTGSESFAIHLRLMGR